MKKIRNIEQLRARREWLRNRQQEIEQKMQTDWEEWKNSLRPLNLAKQACNKTLESRLQQQFKEDNIWKNTLTYSAALLGRRIAEKAREKWEKIFA